MVLSTEGISKSFGEKKVLNNISFSVKSGEALGLLGRNGAGKTTTIRIIMGVFPSDSGTILIDGQHINRDKVKIGYLPEERGLYPKKIINDQLLYLAELKGMKKADAKKIFQIYSQDFRCQNKQQKSLIHYQKVISRKFN